MHAARLELLSKDSRKLLQVVLMPDGINGLLVDDAEAADDEEDWAKTAVVSIERTASEDIMMVERERDEEIEGADGVDDDDGEIGRAHV